MKLEHDKVTMRRAQEADASAVRDLTRAAYAKWVPLIGREPMPMVADYDAAVRNHLVDLFELEGKLAGMIEMILESDHLLIENIAVSPEFQGQGLGGKLMAYAEQVAAVSGFAIIKLYTNPQFIGNVPFYLAHGYCVDREEPFKGGTTVYMSKKLVE